MSKKKDTVSVIVRPKRALMGRLEALAEKYERESANQLMVEITEFYTDAWIDLAEAYKDLRQRQFEQFKEMLKLPMLSRPAATEADNKPNAQGRKKRER